MSDIRWEAAHAFEISRQLRRPRVGEGDQDASGGEGVDDFDGGGGTDTVVETADTRFVLVGDANSATLDMADGDIDALLDFARSTEIDLTVVGPEAPLCDGIVDRFTDEIGWQPSVTVHVAGALRMSEYDFFKAWIMGRIAADRGEPIGRKEDREYTDWEALRGGVLGWTRALSTG